MRRKIQISLVTTLILMCTILQAQQSETFSNGKCKYTVYYSPVRESYNSILVVSFKVMCDNISECGKEGNLLVMYQYPVNGDWGKPDHGVYCKCGEWSEETMAGQPATNPQRKYRIYSIGGMVVTQNNPGMPAPDIKQPDNYYITEANKILTSGYSECLKFKKIDSLLWKVRDDKVRPQNELGKAWDTVNAIWNRQQPKCDAEKLKKKENNETNDSIRICNQKGSDCGYYKGSIIDGKANGKGIWRFEDTNKSGLVVILQGEFKDNFLNGQGTEIFRWKDSDNNLVEEKYEGSWKNGKRNGYGIQTDIDHGGIKTYKGEFLNNVENGHGVETLYDSFQKRTTQTIGEFKDGTPFNCSTYNEDKRIIFIFENGVMRWP